MRLFKEKKSASLSTVFVCGPSYGEIHSIYLKPCKLDCVLFESGTDVCALNSKNNKDLLITFFPNKFCESIYDH